MSDHRSSVSRTGSTAGAKEPGDGVRLISWNLNGRRRQAHAQVAALVALNPDVVAVQEVTVGSLPLLRSELKANGFRHVVDSFDLAPEGFLPRGPRRYGVLTASRYPLAAERPGRFPVPWPERVLSVTLGITRNPIELHNTHIPPGSSNGWTKVEMLNGIFSALAVTDAGPRILCGDFNTPQTELSDGEVVTWAQRLNLASEWRVARTRAGRPAIDWDLSERRILTGLKRFDLVDVFRSLNGYSAIEASWFLKRGTKIVGRRFDHVFASPSLRPRSCQYLHQLRQGGLSDHSGIEVVFDIVVSLASTRPQRVATIL
ncbi:MAG: endonuclease/exonuclease/phosphatase family protein [Solirubrobacterales bacterium]|nr:endonuclease/exonuclease/phosphatase family protein [Solirubrobacterales bacterium]